jgi:hypothetical protein
VISRSVYDLLQTIARQKSDLISSESNFNIFLKNEIYEYETKGADPIVFRTMLLAQKIFNDCNSVADTIERLANSLEPHGIDWTMLGQELPLDRMQETANDFVENAERMNKELGLKIPAIPFGHKNSTWEWMLREYQDGDKFFHYSSGHENSDPNRPVRNGYCMVRRNKIMIVLTTMRS